MQKPAIDTGISSRQVRQLAAVMFADMTGETGKAPECLEKLKQREMAEPNVILHMDYAFLYSGLKDFDQAFFHLNKTYEKRIGIACLGMIFCIRYPMLNELRTDPRFKELTDKMGINK